MSQEILSQSYQNFQENKYNLKYQTDVIVEINNTLKLLIRQKENLDTKNNNLMELKRHISTMCDNNFKNNIQAMKAYEDINTTIQNVETVHSQITNLINKFKILYNHINSLINKINETIRSMINNNQQITIELKNQFQEEVNTVNNHQNQLQIFSNEIEQEFKKCLTLDSKYQIEQIIQLNLAEKSFQDIEEREINSWRTEQVQTIEQIEFLLSHQSILNLEGGLIYHQQQDKKEERSIKKISEFLANIRKQVDYAMNILKSVVQSIDIISQNSNHLEEYQIQYYKTKIAEYIARIDNTDGNNISSYFLIKRFIEISDSEIPYITEHNQRLKDLFESIILKIQNFDEILGLTNLFQQLNVNQKQPKKMTLNQYIKDLFDQIFPFDFKEYKKYPHCEKYEKKIINAQQEIQKLEQEIDGQESTIYRRIENRIEHLEYVLDQYERQIRQSQISMHIRQYKSEFTFIERIMINFSSSLQIFCQKLKEYQLLTPLSIQKENIQLFNQINNTIQQL